MSLASLKLLRKCLSVVKVSDERFTTDELLEVKKFIEKCDENIMGVSYE